MSKIAIHTAG